MLTKRLLAIIAAGCAAVTIIDLSGSLITRATGFPYGSFAIASFIAYACVGILAAQNHSVGAAAAAGLVVAAYEATVGWWISWSLGPGRVDIENPSARAAAIAMGALFTISIGTTVAAIAAILWKKRSAGGSAPR
jgi:hypothetical protein